MTREQKVQVYVQNGNLIEVYAQLKELLVETGNAEIGKAVGYIDRAIDLLSEV